MLLSAVIIVLREVLEASLLVSILMAISRTLGFSRQWVLWALGAGVVSATVYGVSVNVISEWFDGVGQEVFNASLQLAIYVFLALTLALLVGGYYRIQSLAKVTVLLMAAIVSFAITREGFEILIYLYSFSGDTERFTGVAIGAAIGASIGISAGILLYYTLINISSRWSLRIAYICLFLVAGGMLSQAALLLIQADWLPAQLPLWDSSSLLSENSITGQLLYALVGYEATPTPVQMAVYLGGLVLLLVLLVVAKRKHD